jgi:hypothetical protein
MTEPTFKRNQMEGALHAVLNGPSKSARQRVGQEIPPKFRSCIKRLLELDLSGKASLEGTLAFFDARPAGSGVDVAYTPFNVFCLAIAIQLMQHGVKVSLCVPLVEENKAKLRSAFLEASASLETFGPQKILSGPSKADSVRGEADLIFLSIVMNEANRATSKEFSRYVAYGELVPKAEIHYGIKDYLAFFKAQIPANYRNIFTLELTELTARIHELLQVQPVRKRGPKP